MVLSFIQFSAEEAVQYQLESLKYNDHPHQDHGIEVMYQVTEETWEPFVIPWCIALVELSFARLTVMYDLD